MKEEYRLNEVQREPREMGTRRHARAPSYTPLLQRPKPRTSNTTTMHDRACSHVPVHSWSCIEAWQCAGPWTSDLSSSLAIFQGIFFGSLFLLSREHFLEEISRVLFGDFLNAFGLNSFQSKIILPFNNN